MTPQEKRAEIEKLPRLVAAERQADGALEQTQEALKKLAATHDALTETRKSKDAPAFRALLAELVVQGEELGDVYSAIQAKFAAEALAAQP